MAGTKIVVDKLVAEWERKHDVSQTYAVVVMDMFFAAVEIRDNPELKDKPVAVGGMSMISTTNYIARKYGVRSAMPGFIAQKLCPELVFARPNFTKYKEASKQVTELLREYDPEMQAWSLDEAYMNITNAIKSRMTLPEYQGCSQEVVATKMIAEMRQKVLEKTGPSCSAGIGPTTMGSFMLLIIVKQCLISWGIYLSEKFLVLEK